MQVCEENGGLKKKLKNFESGGGTEGVVGGNTPELLRLKAENAALQKSLQGIFIKIVIVIMLCGGTTLIRTL